MKITVKRVAYSLLAITTIMLCMVFIETSANAATEDNWLTTYSTGRSLFYEDNFTNYTSKENNVPLTNYSLAIKSSGVDTASYSKTFTVQPNTYYVFTTMVKTSGTANFNVQTSNASASTTLASSIAVSKNKGWKEVSYGFNTGNNTTVLIKMTATFESAGTVWLDDIRLDKSRVNNVLTLMFNGIEYSHSDGTKHTIGYSVTQSQAKQAMERYDISMANFSQNKIVTKSTVEYVNQTITSSTQSAIKHISYADVQTIVEDKLKTKQYDYVYIILPNSKKSVEWQAFVGLYFGIYKAGSVGPVPQEESLDKSFAFMNIEENCLTNILNHYDKDDGAWGPVHELAHSIEDRARRLGNKAIIDYPPQDNDIEKQFVDIYGNKKYIHIGSNAYGNYDSYYKAKFNTTDSSIFRGKGIMPSYFDYSLPNYNDETSTFGWKSRWMLPADATSTYYMSSSCGLNNGIYFLTNLYSGINLDNTDGATTQMPITQRINQSWKFEFINGYYEISSLDNPSMRLTATNPYNDGTPVVQSPATGADNQKWIVEKYADGEYKICPKLNPSKSLEIRGPSKDNGALAQLWGFYAPAMQMKWKITQNNILEDSICFLRSLYSNKNLEAADGVTMQNTISQLSSQFWKFDFIDGYYEITPIDNPTTRLTATNPNQDGTLVVQTAATGADNQKWIVEKYADGEYKICPKLNPSKTLEIQGASKEDGVVAQLWGFYAPTNKMRWDITKSNILKNSAYFLKNRFAEKNLDATDGTSKQMTITNQMEQMWKFEYKDGYYEISPIETPEMKLTADNTVYDGAMVFLSHDTDSDYQKWIVSKYADGEYKISPKLNPSKALEIRGPSTDDGAISQLWGFYLPARQMKWDITQNNSVATGVYSIKSAYSSLYLDMKGYLTPIQMPKSSSVSQKWILDYNDDGYYTIYCGSDTSLSLTASSNMSDGQLVSIQKNKNYDTQKWIVSITPNGGYRFSPKSNPTKALEVKGHTKVGGELIQVWGYNSSNKMDWWIE